MIAGIFISLAAFAWFTAMMASAAELVSMWFVCLLIAWLFFIAWVVALVAG